MLASFLEPDHHARAALLSVQRDFDAALIGESNAFHIGRTELRVDQVRGIAAIVGNDESWMERDGRQLVRTDTRLGRLTLAYVVGSSRRLGAGDFVEILARTAGADIQPIGSSDIAQFVNATIVEPSRDPSRELPIWLTVAHKLASGDERAYFLLEIPELATEYDPLHAEIEDGATYAESLLPGAVEPVEPTLARYRARLLADLLGVDIAPLSTDEERDAAFDARADELADYVRRHLVSRVDAAIRDN